MRHALLLTLALTGAAGAQLLSQDALCGRVLTARRPVLIYVPQLRDAPLADCLRRAVVDYRRTVVLLTVPYFNQDGGSLVNGLALAGVGVFEANVNARDAVLVLDGATYSAPGLGELGAPPVTRLDPAVTPSYTDWFRTALEAAHRLTFLDVGKRLFQR